MSAFDYGESLRTRPVFGDLRRELTTVSRVDALAYASGGCIAGAMIIWLMGFLLRKIQDVPLGPYDYRLTGEAQREAEQRGIAAQHQLADRFLRLRPLAVVFILIAIGLFVAAMLTAN